MNPDVYFEFKAVKGMETSHVKLGSCYLFAGKGPVWNSQETWSAYLLRIQTHSHISHGKPLESNYQKKTKHIIKHHHHHITIKHHHTLAMIALNSVLLRENEAPTKNSRQDRMYRLSFVIHTCSCDGSEVPNGNVV